MISSGIGEFTYVSFAVKHVMLSKKCDITGVWDAMTLMSALYIDTEYGSQLYMLIHVYSLFSFMWSFRYFLL